MWARVVTRRAIGRVVPAVRRAFGIDGRRPRCVNGAAGARGFSSGADEDAADGAVEFVDEMDQIFGTQVFDSSNRLRNCLLYTSPSPRDRG